MQQKFLSSDRCLEVCHSRLGQLVCHPQGAMHVCAYTLTIWSLVSVLNSQIRIAAGCQPSCLYPRQQQDKELYLLVQSQLLKKLSTQASSYSTSYLPTFSIYSHLFQVKGIQQHLFTLLQYSLENEECKRDDQCYTFLLNKQH